MIAMKFLPFIAIAWVGVAAHLCGAQTSPTDESAAAPQEKNWEFSLSAYFYLVPDDDDYVQPTFRADRDWLHLEARYNYENIDTTSIWAGYNFSFGEGLTFDLTLMAGGVFGKTHGVAPG